MMVVACARGRVLFRSLGVDRHGVQRWYCMNDDQVLAVPFKPAKLSLQALEALFAHAVALNGAISSVNDLAEVR
jgi:hypothetical protein